jgi:hypothetical protein
MPQTPLGLHVPKACRVCGAERTVELQQTIKGDHVDLQWTCTRCNAEWPVVRADEETSE